MSRERVDARGAYLVTDKVVRGESKVERKGITGRQARDLRGGSGRGKKKRERGREEERERDRERAREREEGTKARRAQVGTY